MFYLRDLATWLGYSNKSFKAEVLPVADKLDKIIETHPNIEREYKIRQLCFFETQKTHVKGVDFQFVTESSATFGCKTGIKIESDHFGLTKAEDKSDLRFSSLIQAIHEAVGSVGGKKKDEL